MVNIERLKVGQGIRIHNRMFSNSDSMKLIVGISGEGVSVVPVKTMLTKYMLYNNTDNPSCKHNVALEDCPLPFSELGSDVYCFADIKNPVFISFSDFSKYNISMSDDYATVSKKDMKKVYNHESVSRGHDAIRQLPDVDYGGKDLESQEFAR